MLKETFPNLNTIPGVKDISDTDSAVVFGGANVRFFDGKNFTGKSWSSTRNFPNDRLTKIYLQGNQVNAVTSLRFKGLKKFQIYKVTFFDKTNYKGSLGSYKTGGGKDGIIDFDFTDNPSFYRNLNNNIGSLTIQPSSI